MSEPRAPKLKAQLTPKGILKFPALNKPDTYKNATKYKTGLLLDPNDPDVQAFIAKLEKIRDDHVARIQKWLTDEGKPGLAKKVAVREVVKDELDKEGNETGMVVLNAAMKAEYVDRQTGQTKALRPKFFDAKGQQIKNPPEIWGGTTARLGVDLMATCREADKAWGVGFFLDAVFILDLKGPGAKDASAYGFTPEDGGYTANGGDDDDGYGAEYGSGGDAPADDNDDF